MHPLDLLSASPVPTVIKQLFAGIYLVFVRFTQQFQVGGGSRYGNCIVIIADIFFLIRPVPVPD